MRVKNSVFRTVLGGTISSKYREDKNNEYNFNGFTTKSTATAFEGEFYKIVRLCQDQS